MMKEDPSLKRILVVWRTVRHEMQTGSEEERVGQRRDPERGTNSVVTLEPSL